MGTLPGIAELNKQTNNARIKIASNLPESKGSFQELLLTVIRITYKSSTFRSLLKF